MVVQAACTPAICNNSIPTGSRIFLPCNARTFNSFPYMDWLIFFVCRSALGTSLPRPQAQLLSCRRCIQASFQAASGLSICVRRSFAMACLARSRQCSSQIDRSVQQPMHVVHLLTRETSYLCCRGGVEFS